jgi:hypothetical protein
VGDVPTVREVPPLKPLASPGQVFGWTFFVPESDDKNPSEDRRLLEKALKLARKKEFIEMREDFYGWWSDVVSGGLSAAEVRDDMEKRVGEYHKVVKGERWETATRYAVKIAGALSGLLGPINETAAIAAVAFFGMADIFSDQWLPTTNVPARLKPAAMFHDARARLGWRV